MNSAKVSIIIPYYKPKEDLLNRLRAYLRKTAKGFEILEIDGSRGLANAYNRGVKSAKGEILITIHQDCLPLEEDSLKKILEPFKRDNQAVMAYSWILDEETKKKYYPFIPDGKFVAYRKKALEKVGMFDEKTFFTGGEDVDIYFKLKKEGRITSVNTGVCHFHKGYLGNKTIEKKKQNGSINGVLFRKYGFKFPLWYKSLILAILHPLSYGKYFIKAFITKKQRYRRDD